jgi:energy-converting hydrogenase B subunit D
VIGWLQTGVLLLVAVSGAGVVLTRNTLEQSVAVSFYGLILALMFFLHQAPDVALSQIVVGAVALPLMILLALAKVHQQQEDQKRQEGREAGKARK